MISVLSGLSTIGAVMLVGFALAHLKVLDESGQRVLAAVTFNVATPALMLTLMSTTDISRIVSPSLGIAVVAVLVVAGVWCGLARLVWRRSGSETVIGAFSASYVNANNLGIPMATFVLGDASFALPVLLMQLVLLQPVGLVLLDVLQARGEGRRTSALRVLGRPFRNPLTLATLTGVVLSLGQWRIPGPVAAPLEMLGAMSVPAMLLAFGVAMRLGPRPGRGEPALQVSTVLLLKLVLHPLLTWLLATQVWSLPPALVAGVVVMAGLPSAQNVFVIALRYRVGVLLARDTVFLSTVLSLASIVALAALLQIG